MKLGFMFFLLFISQFSMAQGLIFSTLSEKPKFLMLEPRHPWSGESYMTHVLENPLTEVKVLFQGDRLLQFNQYLLKSPHARVFCDGDFSLANDLHDSQFLAVSSISVCIDENGNLIAYNIGKLLTLDEIKFKIAELSKSIKKKEQNKAIYEGETRKEVPMKAPAQKRFPGMSEQ